MKNTADKLTHEQYLENFSEIKPALTKEKAAVESSRCLFCFEAPCITACPTHIDIPGFILKIHSRNLKGSARLILDANALGASCARVCPVEALCEGACVLHHNQEKPVEIGRLQRYATDWFAEAGMPALFPAASAKNKRIALVGAGPASLSCAAELCKMGYEAILYERNENPGGLNTYGIAQYKMTPETSLAEIAFIRSLGAQFRCGTEVGRDIPFAKLREEYDAVFLGVGLGSTRAIGIPGENKTGVYEALSFIRRYKTQPYGQVEVGRSVAVIGAGNTAIDAATATVRLGAERTYIVYRRTRQEMRAYPHEYELAKQDGVVFQWLTLPVEILGDNQVEGLRCTRVQGVTLQPVAGSEFVLDVDMVIGAVGQEKHSLSAIPSLERQDGVVIVDPKTGMSSIPGVFAGGDCANGGLEVVNAVAEGKRAALGIADYLAKAT